MAGALAMKVSYGWVVVAAGALITCVAFGAVFSLAVYLQPMSAATGWSRTGISSAMTFVFLAMGLAGFGWGVATDRFGPRVVVLSGSLLLGLGQVLASRASSLLEFQFAYGIVIGIAGGAFFAPLMATVTGWFDTHRGLAVSLVSAGMGVAPMTMSPFARWLISTYDWRFAMMIIGLIAWALLIPTSLLVRGAPPSAHDAHGDPTGEAESRDMSLTRALRTPQFLILALTFFSCCAAHSGPIFHTMSYAMTCGIAPMAAVSIYSVEGLSGLGGRLLLGISADRLGIKRVLVAGLLVQALAIGTYSFIHSLGQFYALSVVLGAAYGGVMPLYPALARGYFQPDILGGVIGAATLASALGMAMGPLAGGWVFDHYNSYSWLYVGSCAIGLGATAIALVFPPQSQGGQLRTA